VQANLPGQANATSSGDERRTAAELTGAPPTILPPEAPMEDRASPPPDAPARAKTLAGHLDRMLEKEFEKEAESCVPSHSCEHGSGSSRRRVGP
jgi:hypothetical protein